MALNIDVTYSFTKDTNKDPDTHSKTLRTYQQILYSNRICGGKNGLRVLKDLVEDNSNYLVCNGIRFSSDSIINMYANQLPEVEKEIDDYEETIKKYIRKGYTIGGEIIFPKHDFKKYGQTINQRRGWHPRIKDRFDLTLECIRRFYDGKDSPLSKTLNTDKAFFDLFGKGRQGFKNYVDFFFLNDLVSDDYNTVKLFLGTYEDIFLRKPRPQNKQEWLQLRKRQEVFLEKRNQSIKKFASEN